MPGEELDVPNKSRSCAIHTSRSGQVALGKDRGDSVLADRSKEPVVVGCLLKRLGSTASEAL